MKTNTEEPKQKSLREIAFELHSSKRYEEAAKIYEQALLQCPEEKATILRLSALNYTDMKNYDKALILFEEALPLYDNKHIIHMDIAKIFIKKADGYWNGISAGFHNPYFEESIKDAIKNYLKALESFPKGWNIAKEIELCYAKIGDYEEAIKFRELSKSIRGNSEKIEPSNNGMGFIASPSLLLDMIKIISLPMYSNRFEFQNIVLHFDSIKREVSWANKARGGSFLMNFGYATYDYFTECWGNGDVGLSMNLFLHALKCLKTEELVKFSVDADGRTFEVRCNSSNIDIFRGNTVHINDISTYTQTKISLDKDYMPLLRKIDGEDFETTSSFIYGADIKTSDFKRVMKKSMYPSTNKITLHKEMLRLNDFYVNTQMLYLPGNIKDDEYINYCFANFNPLKNYNGDLMLRLNIDNARRLTPLYVKYEAQNDKPNGLLRSGLLIAQKEKEVKQD